MKKHEIGSAFLILILLVFGVYMINEENKNQVTDETVIVNEETPMASQIPEPEPVADNTINAEPVISASVEDITTIETEEEVPLSSVFEVEEINPYAPINLNEYSSGFVTKEKTVIETRYLIFTIDKDVYVPDYFESYAEMVCDEIELATGMKFNEGPLTEGKISVHIQKPSKDTYKRYFNELYQIGHGGSKLSKKQINKIIASYYSKSDNAGYVCYNQSEKVVYLSANNLFHAGGSGIFAHEIIHALYDQYELPQWSLFTEGFTEETVERVLKNLEASDFSDSYKLGGSYQEEGDLIMFEPYLLKDKPLSYWFLNAPPEVVTGNGFHALGFHFFEYLESIGGYTKWIDSYIHADHSPEEMISFLTSVYGVDIEEGFYKWLDGMYGRYNLSPNIPEASQITLYPHSDVLGMRTSFPAYDLEWSCKDLTINLLEAKKYLVDFKKEKAENLYLAIPKLNDGAYAYIYDESGEYLRTVTSSEDIPLDNIGFVRIFDASVILQVSIKGYPETDNDTEETEAETEAETVKEDKLFPLEGEGQEKLRELFKDSSEQDKRLAELGYYKATEYVMNGVEGYAFLMPKKHMDKCFEDPYERYREAFMRSGFDVGQYPPTSSWSSASFREVFICFTPKPKK